MFKRFLINEEGQGLLEYGLIVGTISIAAVVALSVIGRKTKGIYDLVLPDVSEVSGEETPDHNNQASWLERFLEYINRIFGRH
jgi:Flp pilus assembly pilin Flp